MSADVLDAATVSRIEQMIEEGYRVPEIAKETGANKKVIARYIKPVWRSVEKREKADRRRSAVRERIYRALSSREFQERGGKSRGATGLGTDNIGPSGGCLTTDIEAMETK